MLPGPKELAYWQKLAIDSRKSGVSPHPDECPKLVIKGVEWSVAPRGVRIQPSFDGDNVTVALTGEDRYPGAEAVCSNRPKGRDSFCPTCGQVVGTELEIELSEASHAEWLGLIMKLVSDLLDYHYKLSQDEKARLLGFDSSGLPDWISQTLKWCYGCGPQAESNYVEGAVGEHIPEVIEIRSLWQRVKAVFRG